MTMNLKKVECPSLANNNVKSARVVFVADTELKKKAITGVSCTVG